MQMSTYRGKIRRALILSLACFTMAMLLGFIINVSGPNARSRPPQKKAVAAPTLIAGSMPDRDSR